MEENTNQDREQNSANKNVENSILKWDSHQYYLMAIVCWVVGLGNSWRFAVAYSVNNGAFLLPYILQTIFISTPMSYMEIGLGQFSSSGPIGIWKMCPMWKGVGYGSMFLLISLMVYYHTICSYFLFFLIASLGSVFPWSFCDPSWAKINCYTYEFNTSIRFDCVRKYSQQFCQRLNWEDSASHYWSRRVLNLHTDGEFGTINLELLAGSAITMFLVFLFNCKGTRSLQKVLWFLTFFPYIEAFILLFVILIHPGGVEGIKNFFSPQFQKLVDVSMWKNSIEQSFMSIGLGFGGLIMLGSQCNFRNAVHVNAIALNVIDIVTSICYAIIIYGVLGNLSRGLNIPLNEILNWDTNLMFEKVPFALLFLPRIQQIWAVMLYSSMYLMGLRSLSIMMTTLLSTFYEAYPETTRYSILWSAFSSFLVLILGYPNLTQLGSVLVSHADNVVVGPALSLVCLLEGIGIVCIYGITHFEDDMHFMLGFRPSAFWYILWALLPISLVCSFGSSLHDFIVNEYFMPPWLWLRIYQWVILGFPFIFLIIGMMLCYLEKRKNQKCLKLFKPSSTWGPTDLLLRKSRGMFTAHSMTKEYLYRQNRLKSKEDEDEDETFYM